MPAPYPTDALAVPGFGGVVVVATATRGADARPPVVMYDFMAAAWSPLPNLPVGELWDGAIIAPSLGGSIVFAGGLFTADGADA